MRFTLIYIAILLPVIFCQGSHGFVHLTSGTVMQGRIKIISLGEEELVEVKTIDGHHHILPARQVRGFQIINDTDTAVFITLDLKSHPDAAHSRLRFAEIVYRGTHVALLRIRGLGFAYHYLQYIPFARRHLVPLLYCIDLRNGEMQQLTPSFVQARFSPEGRHRALAKGKKRTAIYTACIKKIDAGLTY